jgi:hypothetical protein
MNWGSVAEIVSAVMSVITMLIGAVALSSWQEQLRHRSKFAVAAKIAERAWLTRYHFYDARNAWHGISEFPQDYKVLNNPTDAQTAQAYAYMYQNRWNHLSRQVLVLARLRANAGALLGEDTARRIEELARKARELNNLFSERVGQLRAGANIVAQWPDQAWVNYVKESVDVDPSAKPGAHTDTYSRQFEQKFEALLDALKGYL